MSLGPWHYCPECGRRHRAFTETCLQCRQKSEEYELVFATDRERERFFDTQARIRHEMKILAAAGSDPVRCPARKADRILKKRAERHWTMDE